MGHPDVFENIFELCIEVLKPDKIELKYSILHGRNYLITRSSKLCYCIAIFLISLQWKQGNGLQKMLFAKLKPASGYKEGLFRCYRCTKDLLRLIISAKANSGRIHWLDILTLDILTLDILNRFLHEFRPEG